jgi:hypothetical protein
MQVTVQLISTDITIPRGKNSIEIKLSGLVPNTVLESNYNQHVVEQSYSHLYFGK